MVFFTLPGVKGQGGAGWWFVFGVLGTGTPFSEG